MMKKRNKNNKATVTADAPRNWVFTEMKKMTGKGAHHSKKSYNRRAGKKVDFS
jgi:hypothetical protein